MAGRLETVAAVRKRVPKMKKRSVELASLRSSSCPRLKRKWPLIENFCQLAQRLNTDIGLRPIRDRRWIFAAVHCARCNSDKGLRMNLEKTTRFSQKNSLRIKERYRNFRTTLATENCINVVLK